MSLVNRLRNVVGLLLPGDMTQGVRGNMLKYMAALVDYTTVFLQGIGPVWNDDAEFITVYNEVRHFLVLEKKRAYVIFKLAKHCQSIDGEYAELGVYKGGSAKLVLAASGRTKHLHLFDTFAGFPKIEEEPGLWKEGQLCDVNFEEIRERFKNEPVELHKGVFPATASELKADVIFALVHIDTDLYGPTRDACDFFYNRMTKGGVMLLDDYGFISCPGVKQAIDEFFKNKPEAVIYLGTGQAMAIKL